MKMANITVLNKSIDIVLGRNLSKASIVLLYLSIASDPTLSHIGIVLPAN